MNIEQRLVQALRHVDDVDPSPDLWNRVVHSIDEERQHRRRVIRTAAAITAAVAASLIIASMAIESNRYGRYVDRPTLEVLEVALLTLVVISLGPSIRRFGRGFAADLWPDGSTVPRALLKLLDVAYFLVFSGYILLTTEFKFGDQWRPDTLADQLADAALRLGGLLFVVGLLHALTIIALPVVALIDNSTRAHKALPRWLIVIGVIIAIQTLPGLPIFIVGLIGGA